MNFWAVEGLDVRDQSWEIFSQGGRLGFIHMLG